jgi:signal recognition particle subunit SRP54
MFDTLSDRLGGVFDRLKGRGALREQDVRDAMREVRIALLEADVALPVVRRFIDAVTEKRSARTCCARSRRGSRWSRSSTTNWSPCWAGKAPPTCCWRQSRRSVIMMVGLQGSGKTDHTAKLAKLIREKRGKKPLMASLDVQRPAAQEQLAVLGSQIDVATLPIISGSSRSTSLAARWNPRRCRRSTCCCSTPPGASMSTTR